MECLLISSFLQSCGDNLPTPNTQPLIGEELVAEGGHRVAYYQEDGKLKANIEMNAPQDFSKSYQGVEVFLEQGADVSRLLSFSPQAQQRCIHFQSAQDSHPARLIIYKNRGLMGGSTKGKEVKEQGRNTSKKEKKQKKESQSEKTRVTKTYISTRTTSSSSTKEGSDKSGGEGRENSSDNDDELSSSISEESEEEIESLLIDDINLIGQNTDNLAELKKIKIEKLLQWRSPKPQYFNILWYVSQHSGLDVIEYIVNQIKIWGEEDIDKYNDVFVDRVFEFIYLDEGDIWINPTLIIAYRFPNDSKTQEILSILKDDLDMPPIEDIDMKDPREYWNNMYNPNSGSKQRGRVGKLQNIKESRPRKFNAFAGERERQLLKQFSSMLFFYLKRSNQLSEFISELKEKKKYKSKKITLAEIQTMHIRYNNKSCLFIAANEAPITDIFKDVFNSYNVLRDVLTEIPTYQPKDKEGKRRVERYSNNFKELLDNSSDNPCRFSYTKKNGENRKDIKHYQEIVNLIRNDKCKIYILNPEYQRKTKNQSLTLEESTVEDLFQKILDVPEDGIVFINTSGVTQNLHSRHAEEFLTDIAEVIKEKDKHAYTCIAGKKRPCLTCYSRMRSSKIDTYGKRPGKTWAGRISTNNPEVSEAFIESTVVEDCYITIDKNGKQQQGYDSGTDDEDDDGNANVKEAKGKEKEKKSSKDDKKKN